MLLWVVMALMTGATVMAVLWPLSRRGRAEAADGETDVGFYRHQMREIDREAERGLLSGPDADAAREEAGRRLLRAEAKAGGAAAATGEPALRRRRAAAALALSVVPLVGLAIYGAIGSPRLALRSTPAEDGAGGIEAAIAKIETHLASRPDDARGWDVIAPVYLRAGRFDDAARAYGMASRGGETPERLAGRGEALVGAAGGVVTADASAAFARVLTLDPGSTRARYYLALAAEQDGQAEKARSAYERIVAEASPDAAWLPAVRDRLAGLAGPAALDPGSVTPAIRAMVDGLDGRLRAGGGTEPEWARLIRAFVVLGEAETARDRLGRARDALVSEPGAAARLDALGRELGIAGREAAAR